MGLVYLFCGGPIALVCALVLWAMVPRARQALGAVTCVGVLVASVWRLGSLGVEIAEGHTLTSSDGRAAECGEPLSTLTGGTRRANYTNWTMHDVSRQVLESTGAPGPSESTVVTVERWDVPRGALLSYALWIDGVRHTVLIRAPDAASDETTLWAATLARRVHVTRARWWQVVGETIVIHGPEDGGTLEVFDLDLTPITRATSLGELPHEPFGILPSADGGVQLLFTISGEPPALLRIHADGTVDRTEVPLAQPGGWLSDARGGGLCIADAHGGLWHLDGQPPGPAPWTPLTMAVDRATPLALVAFALFLLVAAGLALRSGWRELAALRRGVEGELEIVEGELHWIARDGGRHPIRGYGRWLGPSDVPLPGAAVAIDVTTSEAATPAGAYRSPSHPVHIALLARGTRATAWPLVRDAFLERLALVGTGLLLTAAPALALAIAAP